MGLASIAVRKYVPYPRPERFDRFLFIGPHPDDIEIGAGATIARLAEAGKAVTFLICLDGRFGLSTAPAGTTEEELVEIYDENLPVYLGTPSFFEWLAYELKL